ncbi:MAG: UDP-glucose/GDP-mannose dehydrogenase family protein [Candidatus Daviesbacteria bacterium]|nr:UDP-glucose/GDP-mannose dehydrogenase family protein [Candidatus Daviesbacteria bacterium]
MKVAIVGTGYVGLVTGISLAVLNHEVACIDNDQKKISRINKGQSPFYEPGIDELLKKLVAKKSLLATDDLKKAVLESDITIIAVGTPTIENKIDLSFIKIAAQQIGEALANTDKYHVVTVKSTVLPGTTEQIVKPILEKYSKKQVGEFGLCMNPEFLREGSALEDALHPDRIVIGQIDEKSGKEFAKIYSKFSCPKIFTNLWTAELIKYAANSLFATLISYSNEIARIAESTSKIDVVDVWKGVHLDKRLSPYVGKKQIRPGILSYIFSGCGFGGSCFPKDIKALASFAKMQKVDAKLIESVINVNKTQPHRLILHLKKTIGNDIKGKKIAVLGLAFKANTDDIRESAAFPITEELISEEAKVFCHDPMAYKENTPKQLADLNVVLTKTVDEAVKNAEAVIVVTGWDEYIKLTPKFFKQNMKQAVVIDGRRIYDKNSFIREGVIYKGIGL